MRELVRVAGLVMIVDVGGVDFGIAELTAPTKANIRRRDNTWWARCAQHALYALHGPWWHAHVHSRFSSDGGVGAVLKAAKVKVIAHVPLLGTALTATHWTDTSATTLGVWWVAAWETHHHRLLAQRIRSAGVD